MTGRAGTEALTALLDLLERPLFLVNGSGRIRFGNASSGRLAGLEAPELPGRALADLLPIDDRSRLRRALSATAGDGVPRSGEYRLDAGSGERGSIEIGIGRIAVADDCLLGVQVRRFPVGKEASAEGEAILSVRAHDLKQPLQAALGYSELLVSGIYGPLASEQERVVGRLRDQVWNLTQLLEALIAELKEAGFGR